MPKAIETLIYEISLRVRLYMASKAVSQQAADLTERESLILELIGMHKKMSISAIAKLYPTVSNSTISTTITRLWKDRKLVDKNILPENQRTTVVSLTREGQKTLEHIKKSQAVIYKTVAESLGLPPDENDYFRAFLENAIQFFDRKLGLKKSS
jgi:DNA-binding MarR family transcriptional regulator